MKPSAKGYEVGEHEFFYPGVGDPRPPGGAKVHLLTVGGICVDGAWTDDGRYIGWSGLPHRNKEKEARLGIKS